MIAAFAHQCIDAETAAIRDDDVENAGCLPQCLIEYGFQWRRYAAPPGAVRRDDGLGFAVVETGFYGARTEAGEQRHRDRADLQDGKECGKRLGQIRHVNRDHVALADSEPAQGLRQPIDVIGKFPVGQSALLAPILTLPDQERLLPDRRAAMLVNAIEDDVGGAADTPARPRLAAADIKHGVVAAIKANVAELEDLFHEPCRVRFGPCCERVVVGLAGRAQKCRQVALLDQFRRWGPRIRHGFRHGISAISVCRRRVRAGHI